jgi:hypothetical protein
MYLSIVNRHGVWFKLFTVHSSKWRSQRHQMVGVVLLPLFKLTDTLIRNDGHSHAHCRAWRAVAETMSWALHYHCDNVPSPLLAARNNECWPDWWIVSDWLIGNCIFSVRSVDVWNDCSSFRLILACTLSIICTLSFCCNSLYYND